MNIYVGNLSYRTNEDELQAAFAAHGRVTSVAIIRDRFSQQSRGFGFVEMADDKEAEAAISRLNGTELNGRQITANPARPREERPPRREGGFGGGRSGGRRSEGGMR